MFREKPVLKPGRDVVRLWVIEGHLAKLLPENVMSNAVGVLEKSTLKLQMQMALQDATGDSDASRYGVLIELGTVIHMIFGGKWVTLASLGA
jgi:hypothetical protein